MGTLAERRWVCGGGDQGASGEEARIKSLNSTLKHFGHNREEQDPAGREGGRGVAGVGAVCAERGQWSQRRSLRELKFWGRESPGRED